MNVLSDTDIFEDVNALANFLHGHISVFLKQAACSSLLSDSPCLKKGTNILLLQQENMPREVEVWPKPATKKQYFPP